MANVPISISQGGKQMTIGAGATLTIDGTLETGGTGSITVADGSITTAKLATNAVTFDKILVYVSESQTGTGMEQQITHGLGVVPQFVLFMPIDTSGTMTPGTFTITAGMHTAFDILVTATDQLVYQIFAWG